MSGKNAATKNKRFFASLAIIFNDKGEVLLSKRDEPTSRLHQLWQFPGGGVRFGEHPKETVIREVKEEVGINVKLLADHPLVFHHRFSQSHEVILFIYPAKYLSGKIDTSKDKHTAEAKWFNPQEIDFSQTADISQKALLDMNEFIAKRT